MVGCRGDLTLPNAIYIPSITTRMISALRWRYESFGCFIHCKSRSHKTVSTDYNFCLSLSVSLPLFMSLRHHPHLCPIFLTPPSPLCHSPSHHLSSVSVSPCTQFPPSPLSVSLSLSQGAVIAQCLEHRSRD